jgi:alkanesulfonate monooxygenase SsuD/methylene tetrahydromethanopterin reductase-like flavin-dependent oxidoreductase (luciferase family)
MQPNPLQYLAYWAGRTTRVDMGTAVIVAPWWNPVRLASEISMLDILLCTWGGPWRKSQPLVRADNA